MGGIKIPPVDNWIAGFRQGAMDTNPDIKLLNAYSQDFVDAAKCKEIALDQISQGSDVVFQVAGQCGLGALDAACQEGVYAIGVDADQSFAGDCIITSALKPLELAVFETIKSAQEGTFEGGQNRFFGIQDFPDAELLAPYSDAVPQDVQDAVAAAQEKLISGEIDPPFERRIANLDEGRAQARPVTSSPMADAPLLELSGITKRFPGIVANDHVDFDLAKGEVHALLGENGAGKSTLMNILYGLYHPDEGEIRLNGKPLRIDSPRAAIDSGIGMVHQHFMLIPVMTVAENIVLGVEPHSGPFLDLDTAEERVRELSQRFGLAVRPEARVDSISVGMQQRVEILKALYRGAEILILDEPTAVLTPQEAEELFAIVRSLQAEGKSIIFISHKLGEVLAIADRITVLRRGKAIETVPRAGATEEGLARMMVGREVLLRVEKKPAEPGEPLLTVEDLRVLDERGLEAFAASPSRCAPERSSASPAWTATARPSSSRRSPGCASRSRAASWPGAGTSRARAPASASTPASATSPRTASCAGSSSTSRWPRTSRSTTSASRRTRSGAGSSPSGSSRGRKSS